MYPKIFDKTETEFSNNGLGFLSDVQKILVTEERNGGFYVEMEYPLNGVNSEYLKYDYIILVKPNPIDRPQPFRIYDTKKSKNNHSITVKANHITFDDSQNFLVDFTRNKTTASTVLTQMRENRTSKNKITYSTDITTPITVDWSKRSPVNALAGEQGSFIQMLNSEIKRDMWSVTVNSSRGRQSSFVARDEKGLTDFDIEEDVSGVVTKIYPFKTYKPEGSDEDKTITLKEKFITSENAGKYPFEKIAYLDLSQDETVTDEDSLRKVAQKQFTQEHTDLPKISGTLKIINLSKNPEYDFIGELSSVLLCDYIWCVSKTIKEKVQVQVNKVVYNPIIEDYDSLDVGIKKQSLGQSITNSINKVQNEVNKVQNQVNNIVVSSDGTKSFYSDTAPTEPEYDLNDGDIWFQPLADGSINSWAWNDTQKIWQPIFNKEDFDSAFNDVNNGVEAAKQQAQEASNKADAIENKFENDLNNVQIDIDKVKHDTVSALDRAESAHQEALNNTKTIQAFKDETSQKFVEIKADSNALATQVSNLDKREQSSTVQLSNQISTIITNGINLFPNGQFNDSQLDAYFRGHLSVSKVVNGQLQITSKNINTYIRTKDSLMVNEGDVLVCDFDYIKDFAGGSLAFGIVDEDTNKWKWTTEPKSDSADSNLRHSKIELTVPGGFSKVNLYVGIFEVNDSLAGKTFYFDNVYVKQKYVNQTEFNQTIDGFEQKIENVDKKVVDVTTTVNGISTTIKDPTTGLDALNKKVQTAEEELTQIKNLEGESTIVQTAKGLKTQVSALSQNNSMFPNSIFADPVLTNYFYGVPDTNRFSVVNKKESDGKDYGQKNALKMVATASRDVNLRTNNFVGCQGGTTLSVSFDYYNESGSSNIAFNARFRFNDGSPDKWAKLTANNHGGVWHHFQGEIKVPDAAASVQLMIGNDKSALENSVTFIDNVLVVAASVTKSELTQTADLIKGEVSSLDEKTKASLALLQDDINLKVNKDDVITQINLSPEGVLIDGKKTHITNQTIIDDASIQSAAIKDLSADKITTGTLNAANVNITNLDVNKLTGDYSQFLKTAWKDNNSYSEITPDGLKFYQEKGGLWKKDTYLSLYSSQLTWRTSAAAWHYINQSDSLFRNNLTIGAVTNGAPTPASINVRSSGYDTMTSVNNYGHYSGKYTFIGSPLGTSYSDGMASAANEILRAKQPGDLGTGQVNPKDIPCYGVRVSADNAILLNINSYDAGKGVYFTYGSLGETVGDRETRIVYQSDQGAGTYIKSIPTYNRTYSYSSNMFVTSNGYFGRATSAKKYKQDIEYIDNLEEAKRTLDIQPAEWADKKVVEHRAKARSTKNDTELSESLRRRYIGFIADDFADAGFEKLVLRDDKGEVEEFQYDRLSVYHHQMIKDLYKQIDKLKEEIKQLQQENENLKRSVGE